MKVKLEYTLPEEMEEYELAMDGASNKFKLDDVWERIFRPRHKHGFGDEEINKIIQTPEGEKLMDYLENIYKDITNE